MTSDTLLPDDEIDLRELLSTLYRYKWIILGITLAAALATFIFSKYGQPRSYTAQAQVLITKPLYTTNLETSIQSVPPQTPEGGVLKDLALAEDLLWSVYSSPKVTEVLKAGFPFDQFSAGMSTRLAGTSKLVLVVSAAKPETARVIVNEWADKFTAQINSLYSGNENTTIKIEAEIQNRLQIWDAAEKALIEKNPEGIVKINEIELEKKQKALSAYLDTLNQLDLLIRDTQSLQTRLSAWPEGSQVRIEYQLSLIGLYLRAVGGLEGVQIQLSEPTTMEVRTVAEANTSLEVLITSLGDQRAGLQEDLYQPQQDIITTTQQLEAAKYQLTQLTTERDLALNAYQAVSAQLAESQIELARADLTAKVASQALTPLQPVSNRTLVKTIIAFSLAFMLACLGVLLLNWWRSPAQTKPVR
jgi:capsular polysaccharide biosynthesis protein